MTYEEAIKELTDMKRFAEERGSYYGSKAIPAYTLAIEALEKQIAKKPIEIQSPLIKWGLCPNCRGEFNKLGNQPNRVLGSQMFCADCGQALDWSADEET